MVRTGLGQVDLNLRVELALKGFSDTPEKDIAALLRSHVPIEPHVRALLADAFGGRTKSVTFTVKGNAPGGRVKSLLLQFERLRAGQHARQRIEKIGYVEAIKELTTVLARSESTASACVTLANKVEEWIRLIRNEEPQFAHLEDYDLEIAFLYARVTGAAPRDMIKDSLPDLSKLVRHLDDMMQIAKGSRSLRYSLKRRQV